MDAMMMVRKMFANVQYVPKLDGAALIYTYIFNFKSKYY